jgi:hypothetical protein
MARELNDAEYVNMLIGGNVKNYQASDTGKPP